MKIELLFLMTLSLPPSELVGRATVIDGDTIEIRSERIRLHGIDAPESAQTCRLNQRSVPCGRQSAFALADRIGTANVRCQQLDTDRYGRAISQCFIGDVDLNAWMVETGWAVAFRKYSHDYVRQEALARERNAGVWGMEFVMPWDYRGGERPQGASRYEPPDGCAIKGNISGNGRLYHLPSSPSYEATRIDESKGERWFCSEDEAVAAGWKRAH